ncbi:MAG: 4-(cytidine 5'-diphospho)-2-C-methyl-D-erythritol kinase [Alphaproteobacteria bacterium]
MPNSVAELAAAKVNLYLHILGKRDDGYHELQSLVAFADIGDQVTVAPAADWSLIIDGSFASRLADEATDDNLVLRASRQLMAEASGDKAAALRLTKSLPVAAGIGGGSADAAATLRALYRLYGVEPGSTAAWADLGADIPVCIQNCPTLVEGMGERLTPASIPALPALLVNPGEPTSTGAVFTALAGRFGQAIPTPLPSPADCADVKSFATWLTGARNDLTRPAIETTPSIGEVLASLSIAPGSLLARMSGSGATCFALFETQDAAMEAALWISARAPQWWVKSTLLRGSL